MTRSAAAALAALALAGCVSVLPEAPPPSPRYALSDIASAPAGETVGFRLSIEDPQATRAIDSTRIARVRDGGEYVYYAGGEWADRAPRLLGVALVRSFQNTGRILGVASRASQPVADYILTTDIRAFETHLEDGAVASRVEIHARLTDFRGRVKAAKLFAGRSPVGADTAKAAAAALDRDAGLVIAEIVDWALAEATAAEAQRRMPR